MKREFTLKQGLEVQASQLEEWAVVLKAEVHQLLKEYLDRCNACLDESKHTGSDVPRGTDIDNLIANYMIGHPMGHCHYFPPLKK